MEIVWDLFSIALTLNDIRQEGLTWENVAALVVDAGTILLPGVPAFAGVTRKAAKAAARAEDLLNRVQGISCAERFAGAGPEVIAGIRYLEQLVNNPNVWAPYRRGLAAELLWAEQLHQAGRLQGVKVTIKGGRLDFVLITDEVVEFKYWTRSRTQEHVDRLATQLLRYQALGRPLLLELARTKTDPLTEADVEWLLERLQAAGVQITRERIRLVDLP
ncbi:MAG: hypothetical protein RMM10_12375 [Anaerolineae bacterium]|uniref:hypothetical protein n=1 Tax=Thermoflexus sp. TaxID=1969742 RepID=UPI0025E8D588|nr:hypothetical protein [Thermoflexus sp.]MCS7352294.1 hypothetical protein [Thermoflexus sp.]MDW8181757.1 hypothetical protein [Anaerolineae bacterium]